MTKNCLNICLAIILILGLFKNCSSPQNTQVIETASNNSYWVFGFYNLFWLMEWSSSVVSGYKTIDEAPINTVYDSFGFIETFFDVSTDKNAGHNYSNGVKENLDVTSKGDIYNSDEVKKPATYYVSVSTGNNNNNGLTEQTAWMTLSKFTNFDFPEGTTIKLKSGDIWYEHFSRTLKLNSLTITSYGKGNKPKISALDIKTDNYTNMGDGIWMGTKAYSYPPKRLKLKNSEVLKGNFHSELGFSVPDTVTWWYGDNGDGGHRLYIYTAIDPSTLSVIFSRYNEAALLTSCSNLTIDGIAFEGGKTPSLNIKTGNNITIKNCDIGEMSIVGMYLGANSTNIDIHNNEFNAVYDLDYTDIGTYNGATGASTNDGLNVLHGSNINIYDNNFTNWGHTSIRLASYGTDPVTNCKVYGNYCTLLSNLDYGGNIAADGINTYDNEIYNNHLKRVKGSQINGHNNHVHHNVFEFNIKSTAKAGYGGFGISMQNYGGASHSNTIENNIFLECQGYAINISGGNTAGDNYGHVIRNNIVKNCGNLASNIGIEIAVSSPFDSYGHTFDNNLIYSSSAINTVSYYGVTMDVPTFNSQTSNSNFIEKNKDGDQ